MLDDASNQPSKFKTNNWVEINDESRGTYDANSKIKFKTSMLKSSLCDYSDAYKGTITVNKTAAADDADANNTNKRVIFKNCAPFHICVSEINNTLVDIMMSMYNLIEYSDNNSKSSGTLWQFCKDIPAVDNNNAFVNFTDNNHTDPFNFKVKVTGQIGDDGTKNVEITVPLKDISTFWKTLEMSLINCEVNLVLTWSKNYVIVSTNVANQNAFFAKTDIKLYVPVVTLSTQDNAKLLQQLKSGFKKSH